MTVEIPHDWHKVIESAAKASSPHFANCKRGHTWDDCRECRGAFDQAHYAVHGAVAALTAQGKAIVDREDLDVALAYATRDQDGAESPVVARLRSVLSGTAPQPSGTLHSASESGGGISGCPDDPKGVETLSAIRRDQRALARVVKLAHDLAADQLVAADNIAAAILNLDQRDLRPGDAIAALAPIAEEKPGA